jgi:hypothetical protein
MLSPYDTSLPPHLRDLKQAIEGYARGYGLDFFETIFEVIDADDLNEVAAYGGFPTRYPHRPLPEGPGLRTPLVQRPDLLGRSWWLSRIDPHHRGTPDLSPARAHSTPALTAALLPLDCRVGPREEGARRG